MKQVSTIRPGRPKKQDKKQPLTVRLPPDMLAWLDAEAERAALSRAEIIESCLRQRMTENVK